jgi:Polysaccharide lyase
MHASTSRDRALPSRLRLPRRPLRFALTRASIAVAALLTVSASAPFPASAVTTLDDATSGSTSSSTSLTLETPAGLAAGHLLIAALDVRLASSSTITAPSGWTLIRRDSNVPPYAALSQALYFKIATSSEPASYEWTFSASTSASGGILAFSGIDATTPIDAHSGRFRSQTKRISAPSVITTVENAVLLGFFGYSAGKSTSPPSGMMERFDVRTSSSLATTESADQIQATSGASGERAATSSGGPNSSTVGQLVALRPAAASEPAPTVTPPLNVTLPTISGSPQVGGSLTADPGYWSSSEAISYAYQWQRCDTYGSNCASIAGAIAQVYAVTSADVGATLRIVVTARNSAGSSYATSAQTASVTAPVLAPVNSSLPTISGTTQVGSTLTASTGTWTSSVSMTYAYQWKRCDTSGNNCGSISGAVGQTYTLASADAGATIRVTVTATNSTGSAAGTSAATAVISTAPTSPPPPPPSSSSGLVWSADMETGNLTQWTVASIVNGSTQGGSYDSGNCSRPSNGVSTDVAHSGRYSMKVTIDTANRTESGCRQFRHAESVSGNTYYYGGWYYLPARYDGIDYWNVFQFKSETSSLNDPFWVLDLMPRSDGALHLKLRWKGTVSGPYSSDTSTGTKYYDQNALTVPVGRWFHVEAYLKQASDYSGRLTIWQDGTQLYDMVNVKTKYPGGDQRWSVNNYSNGVSPNPTSLYLDDATISTGRVGP